MAQEKGFDLNQIQKLGHELEEIRVRALDNLISKLKFGTIKESDLQRKDLINGLLNWFSFESCPEKEKVLQLIWRLVKGDNSGKLVMKMQSSSILNKLKSIKTDLGNEELCTIVDDIIYMINNFQSTNIADSHTNETVSRQLSEKNESINTLPEKANCKEKHQEDSVVSSCKPRSSSDVSRTLSPIKHLSGYFKSTPCASPRQLQVCFPYFIFSWQPLTLSDCHVLTTLETYLKTNDSGIILQTCQFFKDVMLKDFPAEVFLQRPAVVKMFFELLAMKKVPSEEVRWAVFDCLLRLCTNILIRIQYYSDPCMVNEKQETDVSCTSTSTSSSVSVDLENVHINHPTPEEYLKSINVLNMSQVESNAGHYIDGSISEDTVALKLQQLTLPHFCLTLFCHCLVFLTPKLHRTEPVRLITVLINLMRISVTHSVWFSSDPIAAEVTELFKHSFSLIGSQLSKCRKQDIADSRLTYLQLLAIFHKILFTFVPEELFSSVIPQKLRSYLIDCLFDYLLLEVYPSLHADIVRCIQITKQPEDKNSFEMYENCESVCRSMKASVIFLKNYQKLEPEDFLKTADRAVESLPYHQNIKFIQYFIEICVDKAHRWELDELKRDLLSGVLLRLMAHSESEIKVHTYYHINKHVVKILGPDHSKQFNTPTNIEFLLNTSIMIELICHGTVNSDKIIQQYTEEILFHLLEGKLRMSDQTWAKFIENLIPALPLLLCYSSRDCQLGRAISKLVNPDISQTIPLPLIVVLKGNICLLFSRDASMREEAFNRLIWLLIREKRSYQKVPDLLSIQGIELHNIFTMERPLEALRMSQGFYEVGSLYQVLELLKSPAVDPVVRRSALTQISVMMEDHRMHSAFLEQKGIKIVLNILCSALIQQDINYLPEFAVPAISILKNLSLRNASLRQELSRKKCVFYCILRAVILFRDNKNLRQDAAQLTCLLIYSDLILPVPESMVSNDLGPRRYEVSYPELIVKCMKLPFLCHTHWRNSRYTQVVHKEALMSDRRVQKMLQFCWNIEWFGSIEKLLHLRTTSEIPNSSSDLLMYPTDLSILKASIISYSCEQNLKSIETAVSHRVVLTSLVSLIQYLTFHSLLYDHSHNEELETELSSLTLKNYWSNLPWSSSLLKFLQVPPAQSDDYSLLVNILKLVTFYFRMTHSIRCDKITHHWIIKLLNDPTQPLSNLLNYQNICEIKHVCHALLMTYESCAVYQNTLRNTMMENNSFVSWLHLVSKICLIMKSLDITDFSNLATLDTLLSCLSHLSGSLGWSKDENPSSLNIETLWTDLISYLSEIMEVFHIADTCSTSFRSVNIIRNSLLCLNHILCETQEFSGNQGWEIVWITALTSRNCRSTAHDSYLWWMPSLWLSRDSMIRAGALQLLSGLCSTPKGFTFVVNQLSTELLPTAFRFAVDHKECSLVREQAVILLTNITGYCVTESQGSLQQVPIADVDSVFNLVDEYNFYNEITVLLTKLYRGSHVYPVVPVDDFTHWTVTGKQISSEDTCVLMYNKVVETVASSSIPGSVASLESFKILSNNCHEDNITVVSTPSFIRGVCWLLVNFIALKPSQTLSTINKLGIVRVLFSCLGPLPQIIKLDHCNIMLYEDTVEMYAAICSVLSKCVALDKTSHMTVLHTPDSIHTILSLLISSAFADIPQMCFLRNRLWSEVFTLISALLVNHLGDSHQGYKALCNSFSKSGHESFFSSLKLALKDKTTFYLLDSALTSLTSLLSEEVTVTSTNSSNTSDTSVFDTIHSSFSLQSLLDDSSQNSENCSQDKPDMYSCVNQSNTDHVNNDKNTFGAELCCLLLRLFEYYLVKQESAYERAESLRMLSVIVGALSSLLALSFDAKYVALNKGLLDTVFIQIKELYVKLSLETVDCLRKVYDKRRICPYLKNLEVIFGLLTNFFSGDTEVKKTAAEYGFADLLHKLWIWCSAVPSLLLQTLKMLSTFTAKSPPASYSLVLTSTVPGVGMRKSPSSKSLLHAVMALIEKQMDTLRSTQDFDIFTLAFDVMKNSCQSQECRNTIVKSTFLQLVMKLNPSTVKKDSAEMQWLCFLADLTYYPEGQLILHKAPDSLNILIAFSKNAQTNISEAALLILRNMTFHHFNRSRLLSSSEFLQIMQLKLGDGTLKQKTIIVSMIWALVTNNQKAKLIMKCSGIESKLQDVFNELSVVETPDGSNSDEKLEIFSYVLDILGSNSAGKISKR